MKWIPALVIVMMCAGFAQEKAPAPPGQAEMLKQWAEMAAPSTGHARLGDFAGTWEAESKMWPAGPAGEPTVSKGKTVSTWELGGRFLRQEATGEMMGQQVTGIGYTGYDNYAGRYFNFWIDNTSTAMYTASGVFDPSGKVLTLYGKMSDVLSGVHEKDVKYVLRLVSKDEYQFEMHDLSLAEGSTKVMEAVYRRVK